MAGINAFWVNHLRSASPGVPLRRESVKDLADFLWPPSSTEEPGFLLELLEVMAPAGEVPATPQALQMVSPEGYMHALLMACARDLPRNEEKWKIILKSVPCAFTSEVPGEKAGDLWIKSWNARNKISQAFESLSRTALQTCLEMAALKAKIEKEMARSLTPGEFVNELKNRGLKKASSQDDMSANLVSHALVVAERVQSPHLLGPIQALEAEFGSQSCMNKMANLYAMLSKPTPSNRVWVMQSVYHYIFTKQITNEDVTKSWLLGDKNSASMIAVLELKAGFLEQMMGYQMAKAKLPDKDIVTLCRVLMNHDHYRENVLGGNVAWQGQLAQSSLEALMFIEAVFFFKTVFCFKENHFKLTTSTSTLAENGLPADL